MYKLRRWIVWLASAVTILLAGCGSQPTDGVRAGGEQEKPVTDDAPHRRMTADEIPAGAVEPFQQGDGSASSLGAFVLHVGQTLDGKPAPRPDDLDGLYERSANIVHGRLTSVSLESSEVRLNELAVARIDLVLGVDVQQVVKAESGAAASRWRMTAWLGDPVAAELIYEKLTVELGDGPIGAEVLLFGNVAEGQIDRSPQIFDGLVTDSSGTARLALIENAEPRDLQSIAPALAVFGVR